MPPRPRDLSVSAEAEQSAQKSAEEEVLLYDEKKSQKRDKTSPACGGVFDASHSSEEVLYDAVTSVNVCVFSSPCEAMESTSYTISTSALKCKKVKEMKIT